MSTMLEVCVETLPEALQAVAAGAGRLEVCAALSESGTTPSIGLVEAILEQVKVPVFVMIRPRGLGGRRLLARRLGRLGRRGGLRAGTERGGGEEDAESEGHRVESAPSG